jgi:hypothetical protein
MSKIMLKDQELENKIHEFLVRKNNDYEIKKNKKAEDTIIFDFASNSATYLL